MSAVMREADMFPLVRAWLEGQGFEVRGEVQRFCHSACDVVGLRPDGRLVVIEMKRTLSEAVVKQAMLAQLAADEVYCAIPVQPRRRNLDLCRAEGIGVLLVGAYVEVRLASCSQNSPLVEQKALLAAHFRATPEDRVGGLPTMRGIGPAQDVARAIRAHLAERPGATWNELFDSVPNHYASVGSMRGAMLSRGLVPEKMS